MKLRRRRLLQDTVELNITAFLNLMVVLVPFLLITAVFSRMTVLELNLPALAAAEAAAEARDETLQLALEIRIYPDAWELRDTNLGALERFDVTGEALPTRALGETLLGIKRRFPEARSIALLLAKDVPYQQLITLMDTVQTAPVVVAASLERVELFPEVAVGTAPPREAAASETPEPGGLDRLNQLDTGGADRGD